MAQILDTVLLFSLPASGKSETRTYMASLTPEQCVTDMAMGPTAQLDDYPYVHFMHRIDDELLALGQSYRFYHGPNRPFQDDWTWAMLIELLNEDYDDLIHGRQHHVASAAQLLFDRMDAARIKAQMRPVLDELPWKVRMKLAKALEAECREDLDARNRQAAQGAEGRTIVIEAARGGAHGSAFPLTPPRGYASAFQTLSPAILERAAVLYIWVDPAESRRKNIERGLPNAQGSILHHSVPMEVMLGQYGCDDMAWLIEQSGHPDRIHVERIVEEGGRFVPKTYRLPAARFDNRQDKTTFVRKPRDQWQPQEVKAMHDELSRALQTLRAGRSSL
ncbi:MAG TPA: hypothetical protein PLC09_05895 [Holophaga sp.]|nr:hypothetical protein [Holophaga sp.]